MASVTSAANFVPDDKVMSSTDAPALTAGGERVGSVDKCSTPKEKLYEDKLEQAVEYPENLQAILSSILEPIGLDVHPFLIGWYNEKVGPKFQLNYSDDTLAFVIISGPETFEKCIVPYAKLRLSEDPDFSTEDPQDDCMKHAFAILQEDLKTEGLEVDMFHDFDLYPSRKPKVLVQTAAHVSGAVQYLHKSSLSQDIQEKQFSRKSNLSGVAIHPNYGGWYAIRGVVIFTNVRLPEGGKELQKPVPVQIFTSEEAIAKVIELFAYSWQTNEWRDVHNGLGVKYSDEFLKFLDLESIKRWNYVKELVQSDIIGNTL